MALSRLTEEGGRRPICTVVTNRCQVDKPDWVKEPALSKGKTARNRGGRPFPFARMPPQCYSDPVIILHQERAHMIEISIEYCAV